VASIDGNRKALIDFSQGGHSGKHLDNIADGATYGKPRLSGLNDGIPRKSLQDLWAGFTPDVVDGNRLLPALRATSPVLTTASRNGGIGGDWELSFQASLSGVSTAAIEVYQDDLLSHGYLMRVCGNGANGAELYTWNGFAFTLVASGGPAFNASKRSVVIKRHSIGHFEIYVDGICYVSLQDMTYAAGGNLYMMYFADPCYVSNVVLRGGHVDTPKAYKDSGTKRALVDLSHSHLGKHLGNIADDPGSSRYGVSAIDGNRKALIDLAQAGHTNKHLGNIADDPGTKRSAIHSNAIDGSNVPRRAWLKNWTGLSADTTDGNRYVPAQRSGPPVVTTGSQNGGLAGDWELSLQAELSGAMNAAIEAYVDDGAGHGYLFEIFGASGGSGCTIYKWDGSGYALLAAGGPNFGVSNRSIVIKRHSTGHFEVYVDGKLYAEVQDTTYGAGGNLYLMYNVAPGYISHAAIKGGHFDTPAAHKDAGSKRALVDLSHAHVGKHLGNIADDAATGRYGVSAIDGNRKALIDFAQTGHAGKHLDNIADGSTYGRPLVSRLSSGKPWIDFAEGIHANKNLDNLSDGTTYARAKGSALSSGIPSRDTQHLFPAATLDADGKRIQVPTFSSVLASAPSYQKDIEIEAVVELTANSTLHIFLTDSGSPTGNGYDFVVSNINHCLILREAGGPGGASTVKADFGNTTTGIHHVTLRRHHNGKLTMILDGNTLGTVKDTNYTPNSPIYLTQNGGGGQCYISKIDARGNPTVAADTIDPSSGALIAGSLAAGAATNAGSNVWNSQLGTVLSPPSNNYSNWTSTVAASLAVQNNGDTVEGVLEVIFVANIGIYNPGTLSFLEVQIINDLGATVCSTPNLVLGDFTRDNATVPSAFSTLGQAAIGYVAFPEPTAGNRSYTLQVRFYNGQPMAPSATLYRAVAALRSYAA
jgi:hypothetical protein